MKILRVTNENALTEDQKANIEGAASAYHSRVIKVINAEFEIKKLETNIKITKEIL